jgi:hypothetical protein
MKPHDTLLFLDVIMAKPKTHNSRAFVGSLYLNCTKEKGHSQI